MIRDPQAWARLGQAFAAARKAQGLTQHELTVRAGTGIASVQRAESGRPPKARMPATLHRVARALGWPDNAIDTILAGGDPPAEYREVDVQPLVDERRATVVSAALVRTLKSAGSDEIRDATQAALDALHREGLI